MVRRRVSGLYWALPPRRLREKPVLLEESTLQENGVPIVEPRVRPEKTKNRLPLLVLNFSVTGFFLYGIYPGIMSFAVLPYGYFEYNLCLRLSTVVSPLAALSTYIVETSSIIVIWTLTTIGTLIHIFVLYLAFESPPPPMVDLNGGSIIVVRWVVEKR